MSRYTSRRRNKPNRRGKVLETETARGIKAAEKASGGSVWGSRWPDSRFFGRLRKFAPPAPSDFVMVAYGAFIAIECKSTISDRFPLRNLKEGQRNALQAISGAGGRSFVVISLRKDDISTYAVDPAVIPNHGDGGKKSLTRDEIRRIGTKIDRIVSEDGYPMLDMGTFIKSLVLKKG